MNKLPWVTQTKNLRELAVKETVTIHVGLLTRKLIENCVTRMLIISGGTIIRGLFFIIIHLLPAIG